MTHIILYMFNVYLKCAFLFSKKDLFTSNRLYSMYKNRIFPKFM